MPVGVSCDGVSQLCLSVHTRVHQKLVTFSRLFSFAVS